MGNILQNRIFAIVIAALVIVGSTIYGVNRSVGRQADKLVQAFNEGVYVKDGGYLAPSMDGLLRECDSAVLRLTTVTDNYDDLSALTAKLRASRDALELDSEYVFDRRDSLDNMLAVFEALREKADTVEMSESDLSAYNDYVAKIIGASGAMKTNPYNAEAAKLQKQLRAFPVNILNLFGQRYMPERYDV